MNYLQLLHSKFNGILTRNPATIHSKITQISQIFAIPKRNHPTEIEGEVYEGMIYDVNEDALEKPYQVIVYSFFSVNSQFISYGMVKVLLQVNGLLTFHRWIMSMNSS